MQIVNVEQGSDEWFNLRSLRMTASHAQAISNQGKGLQSYILELCSSHFSSAENEKFSNKHTERGNEYEDEARTIYEFETGVEVKQVGFVIHNKYAGCSPDGLVGSKGLVEFKNPADKEHFRFMIDRKIKPTYLWQMQMQMLLCEREWCDFVSYNPNYGEAIIIQRVYPHKESQDKITAGLQQGEEQIKDIIFQI